MRHLTDNAFVNGRKAEPATDGAQEENYSVLNRRHLISGNFRKKTVVEKIEKTHLNLSAFETSSSAVAKRPRDASCMSVVSFNSTIPRAQFFFILQLRIYKCVKFDSVLLSSA